MCYIMCLRYLLGTYAYMYLRYSGMHIMYICIATYILKIMKTTKYMECLRVKRQ